MNHTACAEGSLSQSDMRDMHRLRANRLGGLRTPYRLGSAGIRRDHEAAGQRRTSVVPRRTFRAVQCRIVSTEVREWHIRRHALELSSSLRSALEIANHTEYQPFLDILDETALSNSEKLRSQPYFERNPL